MIEGVIVALGTFDLQAEEDSRGTAGEFLWGNVERGVVEGWTGLAAVAGYEQFGDQIAQDRPTNAAAFLAVKPLSMSVDEALKYIISMGVVAPPAQNTIVLPVGADPNRVG